MNARALGAELGALPGSGEAPPGTKWVYTFTLKFAPNNYTTITRVKTVTFTAGETVNVDLTKAQLDDKAVIVEYRHVEPDR